MLKLTKIAATRPLGVMVVGRQVQARGTAPTKGGAP
jgi:hypothetical protein